MYRAYRRWYLRWFLDLFGVVPISRDQNRKALGTIAGLLNAGEVGCLFPEEYVSRTGQFGEFKQSFEPAAAKVQNLGYLCLPAVPGPSLTWRSF